MVKRVQRVRDNTAGADSFLGLSGEITIDTDRNDIRVHDNTTPGGHRIQNKAASDALYYTIINTKFDISGNVLTFNSAQEAGIDFRVSASGQADAFFVDGTDGAIIMSTSLTIAGVEVFGAKTHTIEMMADGVDGELITWDTDGVATVVAVGDIGDILTSNGVGAAPTMQTPAAVPTALLPANNLDDVDDADISKSNLGISEVLPGMMFDYGSLTPPTGYLLCDGSPVSRITFAALFAVIAEIYGVGDGSTTFNVPDRRDNVNIGAGSIHSIGDTGGAETHTLVTDEIPAHTHDYTDGVQAVQGGGGAANSARLSANNATTTSTGGGNAHNNLQPFLTSPVIIKT